MQQNFYFNARVGQFSFVSRFKFLTLLLLLSAILSNFKAEAQGAGQALNFDGVNDYIDLGSSFGNFGTGDFTIEVKFNTTFSPATSSASELAILSKRENCGDSNIFGLKANSNGTLTWEMGEGGGVNFQAGATAGTAYNDGQWHQVTVVRTGNNFKMYVDGIELVNNTGTGTTNINNSGPFVIGNLGLSCGQGTFLGSLDDIRIWNVARTASQILESKDCELNGNEAGLVSYFKCNQGIAGGNNAGIGVLDNSVSGGVTGTLLGFGLTGTTSNFISPGAEIKCTHIIALTSSTKSPIGCVNTPLTPITFSLSGGATGATVTGLPTGVTSSVTNGVLTISGTPSVSGVFPYNIVTIGYGATTTESGTITVNSKPTITLAVNGEILNEENNKTLCDSDSNPVNQLQLSASNSCVGGSLVWRVKVGNAAWSDWSANAPNTQPSNNVAYKYQASCDVTCPLAQSGVITLGINYRSSTPQNVSIVADGVTVTVGESKEVCDVAGNTIVFNATCGAGENLLYSVDGGVYSSVVPTQIVDGQFHNYRVRCQKSDGSASCVETESGLMRLKIYAPIAAPVVSLSSTSGCGTPSSFSGTANCGSLIAVWYNATTNTALPTLPTTTPNETTSYYARCKNEVGCLGEKSTIVTFTLTPVNDAPVVSVSSDLVCTGTEVTVSTTCPTGTSALWNTGVTESSFKVAFSNVTKQTYSVRCVATGCQSPVSAAKSVLWKAFELTIINIGQSKSAVKTNDRAAWSSQFVTPDGGPGLDNSTQSNPTLFYSENINKTGPRYWTIHADVCALGTSGSLTFDLLVTPESGVVRSFNTHENNAPYFMYANRDGYTELYAQNHPAYGFYQDNGAGGNVYDEGLPKGLYKLGVRYWDQKGQGSIYPSTRKAVGNVLAYQEYWFRIQSKNGVGVGAARTADSEEAKGKGAINLSPWKGLKSTDNGTFATVIPNPVTNTLRLKVQDSKGQMVQTTLSDAAGREVLSRQFTPETNTHQEEFRVSELPTGMYFLNVNAGKNQSVLKVVKVN